MSFKVWIVVGAVVALILGGVIYQSVQAAYYTEGFLAWNLTEQNEDDTISAKLVVWNPEQLTFINDPATLHYGEDFKYSHPELHNGTATHVGNFVILEWELPSPQDVIDTELTDHDFYSIHYDITAGQEKWPISYGVSQHHFVDINSLLPTIYLHQEQQIVLQQAEIDELRYDVEKLQKQIKLLEEKKE